MDHRGRPAGLQPRHPARRAVRTAVRRGSPVEPLLRGSADGASDVPRHRLRMAQGNRHHHGRDQPRARHRGVPGEPLRLHAAQRPRTAALGARSPRRGGGTHHPGGARRRRQHRLFRLPRALPQPRRAKPGGHCDVLHDRAARRLQRRRHRGHRGRGGAAQPGRLPHRALRRRRPDARHLCRAVGRPPRAARRNPARPRPDHLCRAVFRRSARLHAACRIRRLPKS